MLRRVTDGDGQAKESMDDAGDTLIHYDVVDGQQRLTTCLLLLDRIRRRLQSLGAEEESMATGVASSLRAKYGVTTVNKVEVPRLRLGAELNKYWKDNLLGEQPYTGPSLLAGERRLRNAAALFDHKLDALRVGADNETYLNRLLDLQRRVTSGLGFLVYEVRDLD